MINEINALALEKLESRGTKIYDYASVDSIQGGTPSDYGNYPLDFLDNLNPNGLPPHVLRLAPGATVILLRNINAAAGLCNGNRAVVKRCLPKILDVQMITGRSAGKRVYIPRISLQSNTDLPFTLLRRQFPVRLAWAMTINKAQGQSLQRVGVSLPDPVFGHGQLYVALSRVGAFDRVHVLLEDTDQHGHRDAVDGKLPAGSYTENIVWREVLLPNPVPSGGAFAGSSDQKQNPADFGTESPTDPEEALILPRPLASDTMEAESQFSEPDKVTTFGEGDSGPFDSVIIPRELVLEEERSIEPQTRHADTFPLAFETQQEARCGKHALNNALASEHSFGNTDLAEACNTFLEESRFPDAEGVQVYPERRKDHEHRRGWYSIQVLAKALEKTGMYRLETTQPLHVNPKRLFDPTVAGALVNLDNEHWVALKVVDDVIWLLDSQKQRPVSISHAELLHYVRRYRDAYPIQRI